MDEVRVELTKPSGYESAALTIELLVHIKLKTPSVAQAHSAGITLGNHFQFGIGMPQRFPIAAGTSARTLRHCSNATCRALTRQHGNGALVATDCVAFMQTMTLTAAMDTGLATRSAAGTSPYLARGKHVWLFVSTCTEYIPSSR